MFNCCPNDFNLENYTNYENLWYIKGILLI